MGQCIQGPHSLETGWSLYLMAEGNTPLTSTMSSEVCIWFFSPTVRQNCSTCTALSCFRKFMKRKRRSCCFLISFSSNFSTCRTRERRSFSGTSLVPHTYKHKQGFSEIPTDCFLLLTSAYFSKNGTRADGGSVAGSGWRHKWHEMSPIKPT